MPLSRVLGTSAFGRRSRPSADEDSGARLADSAFGRGRLSSTGYLARTTKPLLLRSKWILRFEFDGIDPDDTVGADPFILRLPGKKNKNDATAANGSYVLNSTGLIPTLRSGSDPLLHGLPCKKNKNDAVASFYVF